MSASTAIGMVGESLKTMLEAEMSVGSTINVTLLAPDESQANKRVNLFLYKVQESPFHRNADWTVHRSDPEKLVPPPLTLNLFYMMTPYIQNDTNTGNTNAHAVLGDAMRVFHENPVIPEEHLVPGLVGASEQVKITPLAFDMEEMTKIWTTFGKPFRLSATYEVSVVQIDQSSDQEMAMAPRVTQVGVPRLSAPYEPPVIESLTPTRGSGGTTVTVHGGHLDGWQTSVDMSGIPVEENLPISGDSFQFTVPVTLQPGFHEVSVNVSNLSRRTFFFEVVP